MSSRRKLCISPEYFINVAATQLLCTTKMLACALDKVVAFAGQVWFGRNPPIDLSTSGRPEEPHTLNEKHASLFHIQFDETSLEVSKQIDGDQRFDQELFTEECNQSRLPSCITSRFRKSCSTEWQPVTTRSFKKVKDRVQCRKW